MSKKQSAVPAGLPEGFFDADKKSKKEQDDDLAKEFEQFEKEMASLQAESEKQTTEEFDKLMDERDVDELEQQMEQWKRIVNLENKAEELKNKVTSENPIKKFKQTQPPTNSKVEMDEEENISLEDIEDFEDKLSDWRSKGI